MNEDQAVPGKAQWYINELFAPTATTSASPVERTTIEGGEYVVRFPAILNDDQAVPGKAQ